MPELAPHYYRDNFLQLLETVEAQYGDILLTHESDFIQCYRQLPFVAQCLYVRLVSRRGPWFREAALDYPELGQLETPVSDLLEAGMALEPEALDPEELGKLCTREELLSMFGGTRTNKQSLLDALAETAPEALLLALVKHQPGRIIGPSGGGTVDLMQLLFFGNRRQGMTDFVLSDLGVARYYAYSLDRSSRLFPGRDELDEYLACAELSDLWWELREAGDVPGMLQLAAEMTASPPRYATSLRRWYRLANRLARELERSDYAVEALSLYRLSHLHPARERTARVLEQSGDLEQALALCQAIEQQPWCEEERDAAARISPRLRRKITGESQPRTRDRFTEIALCLPRSQAGVELRVCEALEGQWTELHYVENRLFNALFGLAFWEQIFAPLPGAFNNPYQSAPADMYEQNFYINRRDLLEGRIAELEQLALAEELPRLWRRYQGYQCSWVNWKYLSEDLLVAAARVIPSSHLLAIWRRMLFDPGENRRGFPDVLALGENPGEYQLIEVKGPGDALQDSQRRWLRFFQREAIPAAVAWVQWADD